MIAAIAVIPYALVALGLRLVMARVFFLSGQAKIEGPTFPVHMGGIDFAVVYWTAILLVLITVGPGAISIDALIRAVCRWEQAKSLG